MFTYNLGLVVGKKIQHALKLEAQNIREAMELWAFNKRVVHSSNWDAEHMTYKGYRLICFDTDDPSVELKVKVKNKYQKQQEKKSAIPHPDQPPREEEYNGQSLGPDGDVGMSINLTPPKEVPDFRFQQTWVSDDDEKKKTNVGFDDDSI